MSNALFGSSFLSSMLYLIFVLIVCGVGPNFRFLDRLVNSLEEKKQHEVKLKEGLKDLAAKRMELQNSLSSSWSKQVSSTYVCFLS